MNSGAALHHLSFPQTHYLPDGTVVAIRPMNVADRDLLPVFFEAIPPQDRLALQENVLAPDTVDRWVADMEAGRAHPILAFHGERIVGEATLLRRLHGWTRHVGYMRCIVHPAYRRRGLGTHLIRLIIDVAAQIGLDKVVVEVLVGQRRERRMLEKLGFRKEAILKDHATDMRGNKHGVVLLSNSVIDLWRKMEDMILDAEFEVIP